MNKSLLKLIGFSMLGALAGFAYYYFVGCRTGTCPITSNPYISTGYGFMMGTVLGFDARFISRLFKKQTENEEEHD
jgi:hypothetical protein